MSQNLKEHILDIISVVEIHSTDSFSLAGELYKSDVDTSITFPSASLPEECLVSNIQNRLYNLCYCRAFGDEPTEHPAFGDVDQTFVRELSTANKGRGMWEPGWEVKRVMSSGRVLVEKSDLMRMVQPDEVFDIEGKAPAVGEVLTIKVENQTASAQPGFFIIYGESHMPTTDSTDLLRFYFNQQPECAPLLIRLLTTQLNRFQIPFQFKCPASPNQYYRRDSGVLYINKMYYRITALLLKDIHDEICGMLTEDVPLFTRKLAHGLGFAEDPGGGSGFGMYWCQILAVSLWESWALNITDTLKRYEIFEHRFKSYGRTLDRPYLNSGSRDRYLYPVEDRETL